MLAESAAYHPAGVPLLALAAGLAVVGCLPRRWRLGMGRAAMRRAPRLRVLGIVLLIAFLGFGVGRAIVAW